MQADYPTANLFKRLAALVYDSLVLMAVAMAYGGVYLGIKYGLLHTPLATDERASMGTPGFAGLVLILEAFYWFFWCRGGQTIGMKAWRLQLRDNGRAATISLPQALVRGLVGPFSLLLGGLGYWWALLDPQRRSWHDLASSSRVVQLPKG